jgi:hypothetical protein
MLRTLRWLADMSDMEDGEVFEGTARRERRECGERMSSLIIRRRQAGEVACINVDASLRRLVKLPDH